MPESVGGEHSDVRLCKCHGEPSYRSGRSWRCAVKKREHSVMYYEKHRDRILQSRIDRWEGDFIHRTTANMKHLARLRRNTIDRQKRQLREDS